MKHPPDHEARTRIVAERERNVVVIAGAGTGKTRTIIDRAVALLAPEDARDTPLSIQRIAAITFTRRAAGELRFRLRERLLRDLERSARDDPRRSAALRDALGNVDAAFIGTIHGFADRLLRLRPVEAELSPSYALLEDNAGLVHETLRRLQRGAELGTLAEDLGPFAASVPAELVAEAPDTLRAAVEAGLQIERARSSFGPVPSLEDTLARMIDTRDVDVALPEPPFPGLDRACEAAARFADIVKKTRGGSTGTARLRRIARALRRLPSARTPPEAIRIVEDALRGRPLYKGRDFQDDGMAWGVYKTVHPEQPRNAWILEQLKGPHRWLATRLVRLAPVACAFYERIKAEHEVVDYLDLLIKLRNLLRDDAEARRFYQGLFDHVFVDEFQDTDPLQCEIVFYLCGSAAPGAAARRWDEVPLAPGKLTIVGAPKQSIYRFRRADIAMYSHAVERLVAGRARQERLTTNFRSSAALIEFYNDRLAALLGRDRGGFDPDSGRAPYEDLAAAVPATDGRRAVHLLPYTDSGGAALLAQRGREVEGQMTARYVRWLLAEGFPVRDLDSGRERPVRPGDIAVLACVTTHLRYLLRELDALEIAYTARGGSLFLGHPIVRQFLLGLRALADRHDGVAEATLLRPPFFAVDLEDHVAGMVFKNADEDASRARLEEARAIVAELRQRRHGQAPGATARDLIERTAIGRAAATGRNAGQTLAALYEIALEADRRAALEGLDFDAVTEVFRGWAEAPVYLETPEPIGDAAVRVMTMHGAKGLEFPVTILWDGFQILPDRGSGAWQVDRDGRTWALNLGTVSVEYPSEGLVERERRFAQEERRRMYYVAATRARDLLAIPVPSPKGRWEYATAALVHGMPPQLAQTMATYAPDRPPEWAGAPALADGVAMPAADVDAALAAKANAWAARIADASVAAARPLAVSAVEERGADDEGAESRAVERRHKASAGRFGAAFGTLVHRALELVQVVAGLDAGRAVELAAAEAGVDEHRDEAIADVERALAALRAIGIEPGASTCAAEVPVVGSRSGERVGGYVDLVHRDGDVMTLLDYKTDAPRDGAVAVAYPDYARQLEGYAELLRGAGVVGARSVRMGLLLTAAGEIRWHAPAAGAGGEPGSREQQ